MSALKNALCIAALLLYLVLGTEALAIPQWPLVPISFTGSYLPGFMIGLAVMLTGEERVLPLVAGFAVLVTPTVVLNSAFGLPTMPVDTHIFRVSNRLGLAHGDTPREIEDGLLQAIPPEFLLNAHHWLLLHGRYICKARKPDCPRCPLADLCPYKDKTLPAPATLPFAKQVP